jgi:hypothetical protein
MSKNAATKEQAAENLAATAKAAEGSVELLLKKPTHELVKKAREHYSVENGQGRFADDFYEKMLPEHISMAVVKDLDAHNSALIAATALVHGEAQLDLAKKDKSLAASSVAFKAGAHTVSHVWKREGESLNPKTGVKSKTFSTVKSSVKFGGAKGSSGELGRVRNHLQAMGSSVLV